MENKTPEEELTELMHHCCGCPFFSYEERDYEGQFLCALLKEECYQECHDAGNEECGECNDAEILAIATYDDSGKVTGLEMVSKYPKKCPREQYDGGIPDWVIAPDVAHHHLDMGNWILRESFTDWGVYYIAFHKDGEWVWPVGSFPFENQSDFRDGTR